MEGNFIQVYIHFVWSTKTRMPVLGKSFRKDLYQYIKKNSKEKNIHIDSINGVEDHVHCMVSLNATQTMADIMKSIKGASSKWLNDSKLIEEHFQWQDGYGAFAVSPQNIVKARNYIFNQEEHHKKKSYDDELGIFQMFKDA
jgi:putative transposase